MAYKELLILVPCHSLEDFPIHFEGEEADGLLANWTALWHPELVASCNSAPQWCRADEPPEDVSDRLVLVPAVAMDSLTTGFAQRVKESGGVLIRRKLDREEILKIALQPLREGDDAQDWDGELVRDFLALGYCYLQIQLLTRQMRYSSNLDEVHFESLLVAAAAAYRERQAEQVREKLQACFDLLAEERDHYYPVEAYLLDITMVAETTLGQPLLDEVERVCATNLLLSGHELRKLAADEPKSLAAVKSALSNETLGIIGGEYSNWRLPLLGCESVLRAITRGREQFVEQLGRAAGAYGRYRFGFTPILPLVLAQTECQGAVHATFEDGQFPEGSQIKVRWEQSDGNAVDALARAPLNATSPETFLGLAVKMGESMDMDHVATVAFAHWAGRTSTWYEDLRRISQYSNALGTFVTVDRFFAESEVPVHMDHYTADQYRSPYLKQAVIRQHPDPISTSIRYWQRHVAMDGLNGLSFLTEQLTGKPGDCLQGLANEVDEDAESGGENSAVDDKLSAQLSKGINAFGSSLPAGEEDAGAGHLVINPYSFVRRIAFVSSDLTQPAEQAKPVYASHGKGDEQEIVVDVPPLGYAWVGGGGQGGKRVPELVDENTLRNEFMSAQINPETGAIQALNDYDSRTNRLSQRLTYRTPLPRNARPGDTYQYDAPKELHTGMRCSSCEILKSSPVFGQIQTRGDLVSADDEVVAEFEQTFTLWKGSRVLLIDVELTPKVEPKSDPWNYYFGHRLAWSEQAADVWRGVNQTREPCNASRFEAPLYIDITGAQQRTTLLTGGLPFHRKSGFSTIDSLLVVRGEQRRKFRLGIGVDVRNPLQEAYSLLAPDAIDFVDRAPPQPPSSWLFHINQRNVVATHWETIWENEQAIGYRVRLLETAGRPAKGIVTGFRTAKTACQTDFLGKHILDCSIDKDGLAFELNANEWSQFEVRWN